MILKPNGIEYLTKYAQLTFGDLLLNDYFHSIDLKNKKLIIIRPEPLQLDNFIPK